MKIIREQLNTLQLNKNTYSHAKIKQELNEYETNKMKRNLEKENQNQKMHEHNIKQLKLLEEEMKITCNQLEELEKQAIDRLKRTKYMNLRLFSGDKYGNNYSKQDNNNINNNNSQMKSEEKIKKNNDSSIKKENSVLNKEETEKERKDKNYKIRSKTSIKKRYLKIKVSFRKIFPKAKLTREEVSEKHRKENKINENDLEGSQESSV